MRRFILRAGRSLTGNLMLTGAVRDLHLSHPGDFETDIRTPVAALWQDHPWLTHLNPADTGVTEIELKPPATAWIPDKVQYGYASGSANTIRPTSLVYPDGRELNYDYGSGGSLDDALSRVAGLVDDDGTTHLANYQYLGLRNFVEVDYTQPDLLYTLVGTAGGDDPDTGDIYRGLDRFGRIKDSYWRDYGSSSDADRIKYGYDRNGNRTWRENPVATANSANYDELYFHDLIDRLKHLERGQLNAQKDGVTNLSLKQCWGLDETGNWRRFLEDATGDNTWDLNQTRTDNTVNEITGFSGAGTAWPTPVYDPAGNMTTLPKPSTYATALTAKYDAWNRLVELKEGANITAQYEYDGAKRRIVKKTYTGGVLSETRHCYFTQPSKWQVIEERVGSSTDAERQFVWGLRYVDDLVLRDRDTDANGSLDERFYGLQDANWNLTSIADASGDIQERYQYDAYGWALSVLTPSFGYRGTSLYDWETRYAGYRFDKESFLYCVRNRMYAPKIGWISRDPVQYKDSLSLYEYAMSRPLNASDPFGESVLLAGLAIFVVVVAGIFYILIVKFPEPPNPNVLPCDVPLPINEKNCIAWCKGQTFGNAAVAACVVLCKRMENYTCDTLIKEGRKQIDTASASGKKTTIEVVLALCDAFNCKQKCLDVLVPLYGNAVGS